MKFILCCKRFDEKQNNCRNYTIAKSSNISWRENSSKIVNSTLAPLKQTTSKSQIDMTPTATTNTENNINNIDYRHHKECDRKDLTKLSSTSASIVSCSTTNDSKLDTKEDQNNRAKLTADRLINGKTVGSYNDDNNVERRENDDIEAHSDDKCYYNGKDDNDNDDQYGDDDDEDGDEISSSLLSNNLAASFDSQQDKVQCLKFLDNTSKQAKLKVVNLDDNTSNKTTKIELPLNKTFTANHNTNNNTNRKSQEDDGLKAKCLSLESVWM